MPRPQSVQWRGMSPQCPEPERGLGLVRRRCLLTRRAVVSVAYRGHEPGWLEPKETAGVETWLRQRVQQCSSGFHKDNENL